MKRLRCFIAVELDPGIRRGLARLQERLGRAGGKVRWVEPEQIHLTLKFLGEIDARQVPEAARVLARAARDVAPFPLVLAGAGCFPAQGLPRVVWAGIQAGAASLARLYQALNDGLAPLGVAREERRFTAHVTLGRVRAAPVGLGPALAAEAAGRWGEQEVEELVLFQSELSRRGPEYTPLARAPLGEGPPEAGGG